MKRILFSVCVFMIAVSVQAQWSGDPAVGTPVVTTSPTTSKTDNVSVTDGAGGMFLAWVDNRNATVPAVYIQRILANGTLKFASEVLLSNASGATSSGKTNLAITTDGAGGAICVWQDSRNRTASVNNDDIYGQRVDGNGNVLWTANGVRVTVADNTVSNKTVPVIDVVNATEAIVVFRDNRVAANTDLYAQKILLSNGIPQWASDISLHGSQPNTQTAQVMLNDGAGGAFVVWEDPRVATTDRNIYAQRIDNTGALLWGAAGLLVCNAANNQLTPQLVADGAGGIVLTWTDQRLGSSDGNIFAQRVSSLGSMIWAANGVPVATPPLVQSNPAIVQSGTDFIVAWNDQRLTGNRDIYAQKIAAGDGSTMWPTVNGVAITNATGNQPSSAGNNVLMQDGNNGAVIVWDDARNGSSNLDIYAQRISSAGIVQWTTDGVPVSTATGSQSVPVAVPSLAGSFIVSWRDSRSGTVNGEIFAARLQSTGVLPIRSLELSAFAKTNSIVLRWNTLDEVNTSTFIVEKSSDGINFRSIGSVKAKGNGNGNYDLTDTRPLAGLNYYRIQLIDVNGSKMYSAIVAVQFTNVTKPSLLFYPNPVMSTSVLQVSNFQKGNYQVLVRDYMGRVQLQRGITITQSYEVFPLSLLTLSAGNYIIQLQGEQGTAITTVFQKR